MDSFGALAHGGWWAVSCICLPLGVVPHCNEVSFSSSVVETWRMGGPIEPKIGTSYPGLTVSGSGVSTISLGHRVMAEGTKSSRNGSIWILVLCVFAGKLDG